MNEVRSFPEGDNKQVLFVPEPKNKKKNLKVSYNNENSIIWDIIPFIFHNSEISNIIL